MDPRFISAAAFLIVGVVVTGFVIRVWMTHPINRAFIVGDFITERGYRALLNNLPMLFALGLLALAEAAAKFAYALRWKGVRVAEYGWADFFGTIAAIFSVWAASCVVLAVTRLFLRKG